MINHFYFYAFFAIRNINTDQYNVSDQFIIFRYWFNIITHITLLHTKIYIKQNLGCAPGFQCLVYKLKKTWLHIDTYPEIFNLMIGAYFVF